MPLPSRRSCSPKSAPWPSRSILPPASISNHATSRRAETQSRLRDDTVVDGKLLESPMGFHFVDAIDFRHLAMKAVEKGQDPDRRDREFLADQEPRLRQRGMGMEQGRGRQAREETPRGLRHRRKNRQSRSASPPPRSAIALAGRNSWPRPTVWAASRRKSPSRKSSWARTTKVAKRSNLPIALRTSARTSRFRLQVHAGLEHLLCDLLHHHRPARPARDRRRVGARLLPVLRPQDV